jgi:hypothetical protein
MMLTWSPRESRRYPRTERCDDRRASVCSSSGGMILGVGLCVAPVMFVLVVDVMLFTDCIQVDQWNGRTNEEQTIV